MSPDTREFSASATSNLHILSGNGEVKVSSGVQKRFYIDSFRRLWLGFSAGALWQHEKEIQ